MPVVHQFAYGPINPIVALFCSFMGALLGLMCTARARQTKDRRRRARWLILAAVAIGGPGIWLMHFMAMIGFDVPSTTVRYDVTLTAVSLITAIGVVAIGLFIAGLTKPTPVKIVIGGVLTGIGVAAMHYTGMAAMSFRGTLSYTPNLVIASVLIAVIASVVALWFTVTVRGTAPIIGAAAIMALAVSGMHYTGMAAVRVHLTGGTRVVDGVNPLALLVPITVLTIATLLGLVLSSMTMMADDEPGFTVDRAILDFGIVPTSAIPVNTPLAATAPTAKSGETNRPAAGSQPPPWRQAMPSNFDARLRSHRRR
jgi:NO-binding membrane sensor protein with MHYT domain